MAINSVPSREWSVYRELAATVETVIHCSKQEAFVTQDLETALKKFRPDFISLLQNPARIADDRKAVQQADRVGLPLRVDGRPGGRTQTLTAEFIAEALTISDLFELNEVASVELLLAGEAQQSYYPGLSRGLVAILLYYDGKACIVHALRMLLQARAGRTWALPGLSTDIVATVTNFTDSLISDGLIGKLLALLKSFDVAHQIERLELPEVRALGPPKHRQQVTDLITDMHRSLADCVFCAGAQVGLGRADLLLLLGRLSEEKSLGADGAMSDVAVVLTMSALYAIDVRILEQEDADELIAKLPVISDEMLATAVHRELCQTTTDWGFAGLLATLRLAWAITIRSLSQYHLATAGVSVFEEEDEPLVDAALAGDVFTFIRHCIIANADFHREEFFVRKIHYLITDFIVQMPLKTKELRNSGDETARIIIASINEGLVPSANLRRDFEHMLSMIGDLYSKDPVGLELSVEFWCPVEPQTQFLSASMTTGGLAALANVQPPQRQISLFKFVRLAGDLLLPPLYVPYINMIAGLANGPRSAHHCFMLLRGNGVAAAGGAGMGTVSWDHFFTSLNQYYIGLRQSVPHGGIVFPHHGVPMSGQRTITPQEVEGLKAVLQLIAAVVCQDESSRVAMCENQQWLPLVTLVGLLTCPVPVRLKAEILHILAAFAKTPHIASAIWQSIETAQIVQTIPVSTGMHKVTSSGIQLEIDEVESRNEEYPMLLAFLELMSTLIDSPVPSKLGAGFRVPGFEPYLDFLRDSVLLKFASRAYKRPADKWDVAASTLEIMHKLLSDHDVRVEDFVEEPCVDFVQPGGTTPAVMSKPPGHTLLVHLTSDSATLKTILFVIDEAIRMFDRYVPFAGKSELERASLYCLKLLETALQKQQSYLSALRQSSGSVLGSRMDKLLLAINARSGRSDHLVNIAKFVAFNGSLPKHAFSALRILISVCQSPVVQSKIVGLFTATEELSAELLRGFAECLELEDAEILKPVEDEFVEVNVTLNQVRCSLRQDVVWLLLSVIGQPSPNLAHFLLGFDVRKPVARTTLQDPGILNSARTCLHAAMSALCRGVDTHQGPSCVRSAPQFAELAYRLISVLCADRETSAPVLRYLRTHDFLYRHAQHLPFATAASGTESMSLMQQAWLMKAVVIELRVTSLNRQRSHTERLMALLLDDSFHLQSATGTRPDAGLDAEAARLDGDFTSYSMNQTRLQRTLLAETQACRKLLTILGSIDMCVEPPRPMDLQLMSAPMVQQLVLNCEEQQQQQQGGVLCNVRLLHKILMNECQALPAAMSGQRSLILEEIQHICKCAVQRNSYQMSVSARRQSFEAWRQLVEMLLTGCPADLLTGELRQNVIFELLQDLLDKVSKNEAVAELTRPVAGVLLTLMSNLSQTFRVADMAEAVVHPADTRQLSQYIALLDDSRALPTLKSSTGCGGGSRSAYASSFQVVLRGLLQHMIGCSGSPPRVRAYLYGALLYYLQIAQKQKPLHISLTADPSVRQVGSEFDCLTRDNLTTIKSFGSNLMDIVCRDACDGHNVGRMLAFAVLDTLLAVDSHKVWFSHLSSRGYLQHIVDSLLQDDDTLRGMLSPQPEPLRALYIFQSKIAFLTRVCESSPCARVLLECSLPARLAQCTVFDMRPESDKMVENFLPSVLARYRQQILFPVLRLLVAVLMSFGPDNEYAVNQVLKFVVAHADIFLAILREKNTSPTLESLEELSLATAVVCRAAVYDDIEDASAMAESRAVVGRLQRQMLALLPRYCISDLQQHQHRLRLAATAAVAASDPATAACVGNTADLDETVAQMEMGIYDILSNVVTLCTSLVTKSGTSSKRFRILFEPNLYDVLPRDTTALQDFLSNMCSGTTPSCPPHLGIVLYLMSTSSQQFELTMDSYKQQHRKYTNLADLSADEIKQLYGGGSEADVAGSEVMSAQRRSEIVSRKLAISLHYKSQQLRRLSYIIENCMFLLWRHLEFYLVYCSPADGGLSLYQLTAQKQQLRSLTGTPGGLSVTDVRPRQFEDVGDVNLSRNVGVSRDQLEQLRQDIRSSLNDTLFTRLHNMEECYARSRTRYGFVSALTRRLRRIVQLYTNQKP